MHNKNDTLPFFINLTESIAIYVIADEVIGLVDFWGLAFHPGKDFKILTQLFKHSITKEAFPEKLANHSRKIPEKVLRTVPISSIAGEEDQGICQLCLFLNVCEKDKPPLPVFLHNFTIIQAFHPFEKLFDFTQLNLKVSLSAEEVYTIFANICTS